MAVEILSPTQFPLGGDDPLALAHHTINEYLSRIPSDGIVGTSTIDTDWAKVRDLHREAGKQILEMPVAQQLNCIRASSRFSYWSRFEWGWSSYKPETQTQMGYENALNNLCAAILDFDKEWSEAEIAEIVQIAVPYGFQKIDLISPLVEKHLERYSLSESLRPSVEEVREWNASIYRLPHWLRLGAALGESLPLHRGEDWADDARQFVAMHDENSREQWRLLLLHCVDSDKAKPPAKWLTAAKAHTDEIGLEVFERCLVRWCDNYGQSTPTYEINRAVFKGLVWSASLLSSERIAQALSQVAFSASRPNAVNSPALTLNLFNACMWSLGQSNAVVASDQLLELESQVKGSRLKSVQKALRTIGIGMRRDS